MLGTERDAAHLPGLGRRLRTGDVGPRPANMDALPGEVDVAATRTNAIRIARDSGWL